MISGGHSTGRWLFAALALFSCAAPATPALAQVIDFEKQIRPVLAASCYECHGEKRVRGNLRLDAKELTMTGGTSGPALLPGRSKESLLIKRLRSGDESQRMPFKKPPLPEEQIRLIEAWIDQGAVWPEAATPKAEKHWAYVKPVRFNPPAVKDVGWVRNPIDRFILARLEKEGIAPAPEADRATLIRRLYLDLLGLVPPPAEVDAFIADVNSDAYEKLVDRLLASPHYGERWGRHWLDLARYADTNGYEKDRPRIIWPYRDWVINALNADMPFDQFAIEQLAGDMLPNATDSQRIATGFNRNSMFNEEGGIDVEEFRYKAIVDRVQTVGTAFMGLTMHCAQCHNHKYDAISQKEYFQFFALLNNTDEPEMTVAQPEIVAKRKEIEAKIKEAEAALENQFPPHDPLVSWEVARPDDFSSSGGAILSRLEDSSLLASGTIPETDTYTVQVRTSLKNLTAIKLEALTHPSLAQNGPGRYGQAGNGNFVVSEIRITAAPAAGGAPVPIALSDAQADFSQPNYPVANAIDGNAQTGWAVDDGTKPNKSRSATFKVKPPAESPDDAILAVSIEQNQPGHTLGRFRISLERTLPKPELAGTEQEQRKQHLSAKMQEWEKQILARSVRWKVLEPVKFSRNYEGTITKLPDQSLLFTGDNYYRDDYQLEYRVEPGRIRAIRLEVLPHPDLNLGGPGRGHEGGFLLTEFRAALAADGQAPRPIKFEAVRADDSQETAQRAIDEDLNSHWTINEGRQKPRTAIFVPKQPADASAADRLSISIILNLFDIASLGRVRISVTDDPRNTIEPAGVPADIESIVGTPCAARTPEQVAQLKSYFLSTTPLLSAENQKIAELRKSLPKLPTTLIMKERAVTRTTHLHHRGEYLQPREVVTGAVPAILPQLPKDQPANRLTLARWITSPENPLTSRVVVNRFWSIYFGHGISQTVEDFGNMGEKPTYPELLDWLATELQRQKWSMKAIHRLIVTSATYRQSSNYRPELQRKDPENRLLARGPRLRVEAEITRDIALSASGLLAEKIGGPSVFPPQPPGISELAYGPLQWNTSQGADRYRRGLYTFLKRTTPYPGLSTFDATSMETVCARRVRSNTPLQALTMLNDPVFVEAAQALARRVIRDGPKDAAGRAIYAFRLCMARQPDQKELALMLDFYNRQMQRFAEKSAEPLKVAFLDKPDLPKGAEPNELAAMTTLARAILNLDETITKE